MKTTICALLTAMLLAGCQTATRPSVLTAGEFDAPVRPGETRLSIRNVDRDKWVGRGIDTLSARRTVFVCRPLACASPSAVIYPRLASPTRKPDPQALLDLGQRVLDEQTRGGAIAKFGPKPGTVKGFPSFSFGYSREVNGKTEFARNTAVFAGSLAFNLLSISQDEAVAARNLEHFISAIEIKDGGSRRLAQR